MIGRPVPQDQRRAYWQALEVMGRGIDTLKPDQPLILQRTALVTSVQAAVDAVFLANDAEPPFESAADAENLFPARSLADNLSQARADVLALGRAGFGTVRFAFSRSLGSLADCLESADTANAQAAHVAELRFQAERLKRSDSLAFGQAGWSKAGLLAALDALDGIALAKGSGWSQAARTVVEGITDRDSVAFQRAALQDGFRATVDAFTAQLSRTHLVR